ncbi:MAG: prepilin peptidase [Pirellulales bacterium]|nr:prepilin peptidase [Pirellulales bacterium]
MNILVMQPIEIRLALVFLVGCGVGSAVNWAIYALAWNRRPFSPWSAVREGVPPRAWLDRVPVMGWWRLRREAFAHGRGFWIRPLFIDLLLGVGLAILYWWEIECQGLYSEQVARIARELRNPAIAQAAVPAWLIHVQFASHAILIAFMVAASFIDIDEKLIPDGITVVGTLVGLSLAAIAPRMLLPHADMQLQGHDMTLSTPLELHANAIPIPGNLQVVARAVTLAAPNPWPDQLRGAPQGRSLALGLACYWLWCFALLERIWRGGRGFWFGVRLIIARILRDLRQPPVVYLVPAGSLAILGVWWQGGDSWAGLLSALVGLVGGGGIVWAVRIIGSAALKREAMGFGDVTLMMMIGVFLGWQACLILFFLAPFAGLLIGLLQWIFRRDDVIPYGPFLCLAAGYTIVCWASIWNWGHQLFQIGGLVPMALVVCLAIMGVMLVLWQAIKESIREWLKSGQ